MRYFCKASHTSSTRLITISAVVAFLAIMTFSMRSADSAGPRHQPDRANHMLMATAAAELLAEYHGSAVTNKTGRARPNEQPGIREDIPARYLARYHQWKREFLKIP